METATARVQDAAEERSAHLHFLESLDRVNRAMQGSNDLEQMVSDVLDALDAMLSIFDCDRAGIGYADPDAPIARVLMLRTRPGFALDPAAVAGPAISRSIVEAHGGRIWATPNDGGATSMCFALPVASSA